MGRPDSYLNRISMNLPIPWKNLGQKRPSKNLQPQATIFFFKKKWRKGVGQDVTKAEARFASVFQEQNWGSPLAPWNTWPIVARNSEPPEFEGRVFSKKKRKETTLRIVFPTKLPFHTTWKVDGATPISLGLSWPLTKPTFGSGESHRIATYLHQSITRFDL